jgi:phosphoglycolate phosphatase-like HAD superfamily hydrolase
MALKHIVFDCDGVLWEGTNEGYVKCYHQAALDAGLALDYDLARQRILDYWGQSAQVEVEQMIPEHPDRVAEVLRHYRRRIRTDLFLSTASLIDGVRETLQRLSRAYRLSAITGMNPDNLTTLLARFQLRPYFEHLLSSGESDDPEKQKPTGYHLRLLLEREGLEPNEALCIGDAECDVQMAQRRKVPIVVVLTGTLTEARARRLDVAAILPSVRVLPEWIAQRERNAA